MASFFPSSRGPKKHIHFFNISWAPRKKSLCASFPGKGRKKGTHMNFFRQIFGVKKGVPNGPFSATKILLFSCPYLLLFGISHCTFFKRFTARRSQQTQSQGFSCGESLQLQPLTKNYSPINYASWGPISWPSLRRSARTGTIKAVRETVATKGMFGN